MTAKPVKLELVRPEHRIFWAAQTGAEAPANVAVLRRFFVQYARSHRRAFPWREAGTTPYELMLAELLLVQTKAEDVAAVLPKLVAHYPSAERLANAQSRSLITALRPLGLQNQRARALRGVAKALVERFAGQVTTSLHELLSLPHIGLYVACAVACFSHGQRVPIVDSNVLRVLGRIYGINAGRELRRSPEVWRIAWKILPRRDYALHNYGILDFAAEICKSRSPQCHACALNHICAYAMSKKEERQGRAQGIE